MINWRRSEAKELTVNQNSSGVALADAIELVRSELQKAEDAGRRSPLAFVPGAVELEFEVVFDR